MKSSETKKKCPYVERDISWMYFNQRILLEAARPEVPLLERLTFLGIYSNNLDEFFRVRVATLNRIIEYADKNIQKEQETATRTLKQISKLHNRFYEQFEETFASIMEELKKENICVIKDTEMTDDQKTFITSFYRNKLNGSTTPLFLNGARPLDDQTDEDIYLAIRLLRKDETGKIKEKDYAVIELPTEEYGRFIQLPDSEGKTYLMFLDDVIRYCLPLIFVGMKYTDYEAYTFKFTKDAEMEIDSDLRTGVLQKISKGVKSRKRGEPIRFVYDEQIPKDLLKRLVDRLNVDKNDTRVAGGRYHNFKDLMKFPKVRPDLLYAPQRPIQHPSISLFSSILEVIARRDIFLNYPYHTFQHFIDFLREAAIDPRVESIYITLYRTAEHSKVINALVNAVKNGKKVYAMLELKARFDEEQNMENTDLLQREGVKILHTMEDLKVHSKVVLVERRERRGMKRYAYIGTGNFNENTALIYSDFGLFTSHDEITEDVLNVFLFLSNNHKQFTFKHLMVSPYYMRMQFVDMIDREISHAKKGKKAYIYAKCNSLTDVGIIEKLYEAGRAGVEVRLIVRGACCLLPQVEAMSENIRAISIVDKYLEHARLYIFCNGGDERIYTGSADWMARNLDRRVEVCVPLYDEGIRKKARDVFEIQWHDTVKARLLDEDRQNTYVKPAPGAAPLRSQTALYDYYGRLSNYKK